MKHPTLFDLAPGGPTVRTRLTEFKEKHGIKTHRTPNMLRKDHAWIALLPSEDDKDKDIGTIMAGVVPPLRRVWLRRHG